MRRSFSLFCISFISVCFLFSLKLSAQEVTQSGNGIHEHDGFFLRLLGGPGYAQMSEKGISGGDLKLSGVGMPFIVQIGGVVDDNLIVYGIAGGVTVFNPDLEWGTKTAKTSDTRLMISNFGGGVTYYLMPSNFYFSGSVLASRVTLQFENMKANSKIGFGFNLIIGKEWWVSNDWALGAAIFGHYSQMSDVETINNIAGGILFSATLN